MSQQIPNGSLHQQKIVTITKNDSDDHTANNLNVFSTIQPNLLTTNSLVNVLPTPVTTATTATTTTTPSTQLIQSNYVPNLVEMQQKAVNQQVNNSNQLEDLNKNENGANGKEDEIDTVSNLASDLTKTSNSLVNSAIPPLSSSSSNVALPNSTSTATVLNSSNINATSVQLNNTNSHLNASLQSQQTQAPQTLNVTQAGYQTTSTSVPQIVQLPVASNSNTNLSNQVSPKERKTSNFNSAPIPTPVNLNDQDQTTNNMQAKMLNPTSNALNDIISQLLSVTDKGFTHTVSSSNVVSTS